MGGMGGLAERKTVRESPKTLEVLENASGSASDASGWT
jgi:hypothetical protein